MEQSMEHLRKPGRMASSIVRPKILIVDDEEVVRSGVARVLKRKALEVSMASDGLEALEMMTEESFDVVFLDIKMNGMDGMEVLRQIRRDHPAVLVIMITGFPSVETAVECLKAGAVDYLMKPFRADDLESVLFKALENAKGSGVHCQPQKEEAKGLESIIGRSQAMQEVFAKMSRSAPGDSTVLISGESGTGKELVARSIHKLSTRADREFVGIDCSALVESLLESELFGHVKGSFTGAFQTKHGLFELADHGTFFFDEISNLSLNIQAKLLRVIQEREFMKVGSQKKVKLNIRIIASSNRDLREAVRAGTFREDLFYRLSVIPIHLPPLRKRREDIPLLVEHFIEKHNRKCQRQVQGISKRALDMLMAYDWPGNVRELEHAIERILILEDGNIILPEQLPAFIKKKSNGFRVFSEEVCTLDELEKRYIQFVLRRTKGKRQEAAHLLGINRKTLGMKINKYGLKTR